MRPRHEDILSNAELEVEYVFDFVGDLSSTDETRKLWRAWAGILDHYVKAVSAMRRATSDGGSKRWSDDLLHQQKNDPILQYAYQARDHATHVFEEKREANPRSTSIGNFISVSGNSRVTLENNYMTGPGGIMRKLPDGVLETNDGRYAGGTIPKNAVLEREHYIVVADVKTRSGIWHIPNPDTHPEKRALEIAGHLAEWLKTSLLEAKKLSANERRSQT